MYYQIIGLLLIDNCSLTSLKKCIQENELTDLHFTKFTVSEAIKVGLDKVQKLCLELQLAARKVCTQYHMLIICVQLVFKPDP